MKIKRDLWILGATSLVIAVVLFIAIGVGTRQQQQEMVQKLEDDVFHGRSENVRRLVSTTDVLVHEPHVGGLFLGAVLNCDAATVQTLIDKGVSPNSRVAKDDTEPENAPTGFTALDLAVQFNRVDIVAVLLHNGADANLKTGGLTAIDMLKYPFNIKRAGGDAQIAHLLREAQRKGSRDK